MTALSDARKFIFESADVRGEIVRLDRAFQEITAIHQYAPGVSALLGEFLAAAVLLSTTIKYQGRLILQAQSQGEIPLMMAECTNDLKVRAIARGADEATALGFDALFREGRLAITIEPVSGKRYQGIVSLDGENLAACIENYFQHSEQLATRLWLACDGERAAGLLLQQLPAEVEKDPEQRTAHWEHLSTLAATLRDSEMVETPPRELLYKLFHQDPMRVFDERPVVFECSCSAERCLGALVALGEEELRQLFREEPTVTMDCEFCNRQYQFSESDFDAYFSLQEQRSLH